jgi:hypothetical protein
MKGIRFIKQQMSSILTPSEEQQEIINLIATNNVIVEAVAGSGKTTTCLHIAKTYPKETVLILTYNARLKIETRERVASHAIENVEVHSYHSYAVKYYNPKAFIDKELKKIVDVDTTCRNDNYYEIIILDECQDMTPLLYRFARKIIADNDCAECRICVLGDRRQCIFSFSGADARYLAMSDELFCIKGEWKRATLSTSYRLSKPVAKFVNRILGYGKNELGAPIQSNSLNTVNIKPEYVIMNLFNKSAKSNAAFGRVMQLLKTHEPGDIFILAPSIKSDKSPVRILANLLTEARQSIYVPMGDEVVDSDISEGKITFATFHQVKGLERPIIIVFGFDASYFTFYARGTILKGACPNPLYVACTRATEYLILIQGSQSDPLQFITEEIINETCTIVAGKFKKAAEKTTSNPHAIKVSISRFVRHLPIDVLEAALSRVKTSFALGPTGGAIPITPKISTDNGAFESVTEINHSVPLIKYSLMNGLNPFDDGLFKKFPQCVELVGSESAEDLLKLSTYWSAYITDYMFKTVQISSFDWMDAEKIGALTDRLEDLICLDDCEISTFRKTSTKFGTILSGVLDCITAGTLYVFRCCDMLTDGDIIYTVCAAHLALRNGDKIDRVRLFNLMDGSYYTVEIDEDAFCAAVDAVAIFRYESQTISTDETFLSFNHGLLAPKPEIILSVVDGGKPEHLPNLIFLDIETTKAGAIIEIAWIMTRPGDEWTQIESRRILVNDGSGEVDFYEKLTLEEIERDGISPAELVEEMCTAFVRCGWAVGHNIITFDMPKINALLDMHHLPLLNPPILLDTMRNTKRLLGLKTKSGAPKYPTMSELYAHFCGKTAGGDTHTAEYDTRILFDAFRALCNHYRANPELDTETAEFRDYLKATAKKDINEKN